jgi:hypothetical protein
VKELSKNRKEGFVWQTIVALDVSKGKKFFM